LSDGSNRKVLRAVEAAGDGAYHLFDYVTQEAVIMRPSRVVPLPEWPENGEVSRG
jgi:hypothetical protein